MPRPITGLLKLLDRGVEIVVERTEEGMFDDFPKREPTVRDELLRSVEAGEATCSTPGIEEAIRSGLVVVDAEEKPRLTPLGKYLLPVS